MADITRADVVAIRDRLAKLVLDGKVGAQRALNLWSNLKAPLSYAFSGEDDPKYKSVSVGPVAESGARRAPAGDEGGQGRGRARTTAVRSRGGLALLSAEAVPPAERRLYAIALYTGLRSEELYGLFWSDVRLDQQVPIVKAQRGRDDRTLEE